MDKISKKLPLRVRRRLDLSGMFYPLARTEERRWARLFNSEFPAVEGRFKELALEKMYRQTATGKDLILWRDTGDSSVEAMFYFIRDPANLIEVSRLFRLIKKHRAFCTYAVVHQKKDGENCFDIFRSTPFSYLEHCNRVRYPMKKKGRSPNRF